MSTLRARGKTIHFPRRPLVMGILNINDDSFSGDGRVDTAWALDRAREMVTQGADIVDAGAESARTNRPPIEAGEEIRRLEPFLRGFKEAVAGIPPRDALQVHPPWLSINTWRPEVAGAALAIAGDVLNDLGALPDAANARLCASHGAALLIMHSSGLPKQKHTHIRYNDVMDAIERFFEEKLEMAAAAGLEREAVILDPGLDFAKHGADNLAILRHTRRLLRFGRPVLLPVSRKSFIGRTLGIEEPRHRDAATAACLVAGMAGGADIFRVHNVDMAWHTIHAVSCIQRAGAGD